MEERQRPHGEAKPDLLRRRPSRARGHRRVKDLLRSAAEVFVEKGFDAATMTEIAARAGASIGSLYQFFPTKDSIADKLRAEAGDFLCREWERLGGAHEEQSPEEFAAALLDIGDKMLEEFPSFVPLVSIRGQEGENLARVRARMSQALSALIEARMPGVTKAKIETTGIIIRELMRCQIDIKASQPSVSRRLALADLEIMLAQYLVQKLGR